MWSIELLTLLEFSLNLILLGLILLIQFVHYPLFKAVPEPGRFDYHQAHMRAITPLVLPLMVSELILMGLLTIVDPYGLVIVRLMLLMAIWASTFFIQVPLHEKIAQNPKRLELVDRLVLSNWIRTIAWLLKAILGALIISA